MPRPQQQWAPTMPQPFTHDEVRKVKKLMVSLFGDRAHIFYEAGLWHLGKYLDNGPPDTAHGPDRVSRKNRSIAVYACAATLTEAMQTFTGGGRVYSAPGMAPSVEGLKSWRVIFDQHGRVRGFRSPAGVFSKRFPGQPGEWS